VSLEQILKDIGPEISDVRATVNGRPTGVDVDLTPEGIARLKFFDLPRVSIKKMERHIRHRMSSRAE